MKNLAITVFSHQIDPATAREWRQGSILMTFPRSPRNRLKLILLLSAYIFEAILGTLLNAPRIVSCIPFCVFHCHFAVCNLIFELAASGAHATLPKRPWHFLANHVDKVLIGGKLGQIWENALDSLTHR